MAFSIVAGGMRFVVDTAAEVPGVLGNTAAYVATAGNPDVITESSVGRALQSGNNAVKYAATRSGDVGVQVAWALDRAAPLLPDSVSEFLWEDHENGDLLIYVGIEHYYAVFMHDGFFHKYDFTASKGITKHGKFSYEEAQKDPCQHLMKGTLVRRYRLQTLTKADVDNACDYLEGHGFRKDEYCLIGNTCKDFCDKLVDMLWEIDEERCEARRWEKFEDGRWTTCSSNDVKNLERSIS